MQILSCYGEKLHECFCSLLSFTPPPPLRQLLETFSYYSTAGRSIESELCLLGKEALFKRNCIRHTFSVTELFCLLASNVILETENVLVRGWQRFWTERQKHRQSRLLRCWCARDGWQEGYKDPSPYWGSSALAPSLPFTLRCAWQAKCLSCHTLASLLGVAYPWCRCLALLFSERSVCLISFICKLL